MKKETKIILFDGVCNLCNGFVQYVIEHDEDSVFKFASLQSDFGQKFLKKNRLKTQKFDSFILLDENQFYTESTAAIKVLSELKSYKYIKLLLYCPPFLRNSIYKLIAKNRYSLFGKSESCWLPTPELKSRFL